MTAQDIESRIEELKKLMKSSNSLERNAAAKVYNTLYATKGETNGDRN
jgi:hypothetical protein